MVYTNVFQRYSGGFYGLVINIFDLKYAMWCIHASRGAYAVIQRSLKVGRTLRTMDNIKPELLELIAQ